ncbi:hypothetical protein DL96DRAFT_1583568 [Flagelloscypha sp. PMI_526]|nr:hypothetical protein DL96DRAFT_1583568 [Flagelloscypha sp. PMI_526]
MPHSEKKDNSLVEEEENENNSSGDGEEEDEEEFEIETILKHSDTAFEDGAMGFWVKWKGYPSSENSWVRRADAGNASDLIDEYMEKVKQNEQKALARKARKEGGSTIKKSRRDESPSKSTTSKRGVSASTSRSKVKSSASDDGDAEMADGTPPPRKSTSTKRKRAEQHDMDVDGDDSKNVDQADAVVLGTVPEPLRGRGTWAGDIRSIDTVERDPSEDNQLFVYFTLKNGKQYREKTEVGKQKFPLLLIDFYEANLRWRHAESSTT